MSTTREHEGISITDSFDQIRLEAPSIKNRSLLVAKSSVDEFCQKLKDVRDDVDKPTAEKVIEDHLRTTVWVAKTHRAYATDVASALREAGLLK